MRPTNATFDEVSALLTKIDPEGVASWTSNPSEYDHEVGELVRWAQRNAITPETLRGKIADIFWRSFHDEATPPPPYYHQGVLTNSNAQRLLHLISTP